MKRLLLVLPLLLLGADYVHMDDTTKSWLGPIPDCTNEAETLGYDAATESFECNTDSGGAGGNAWTTFGVGTADSATDTFTVTDSPTIDFTTTNDPEDLTAIVPLGSIGTTHVAGLDAADTTTGTFADGLVGGASEADEVVATKTDEQGCSWESGSSLIECDGSFATPAGNDNDTSPATTAFVQGEIDDGDFLTDNCTLENDATPIPDACVGDGSDAGAATGTLVYTVIGLTLCGNGTEYMGAGGTSANCNATESNVRVTHAGPTLTVGNLKCAQYGDGTCTTVFTIMKNGGASAAAAATCTNIASCAAGAATDTIANGDTWSIRVVDNLANCTSGIAVDCQFTATY